MKDNERKRRDVHVASREELLRSRRDTDTKQPSTRRITTDNTGRSSSSAAQRRQSADASRPQRSTPEDKKPRKTSSQNTATQKRRRADLEELSKTSQKSRRPQTSSSANRQGKKRKKKKKSFIRRYSRLILVLFVFLLILIMLISGIAKLFAGSKGRVRSAYSKTMSLYQKRTPILQTILGKDVEKLIKKGNYSQSFTLLVTDNTAGAKNIGISGSLNKFKSSKTADAQLSAEYNGASIAQLKMYTDNNDIMFSAPGIYDNWLKMECENIVSQLDSSALAATSEFSSDCDFSLKMFDDTDGQNELMSDLGDQLLQIFNKEINSLSKKATYSKIKEKKPVSIDGTDKNLRGYKVTMKGEDFKNFLVNFLSKVRTNKKVKGIFRQYAQLQYNNVELMQMLYDSPDEIVDNYYKQIDYMLAEIDRAQFIDTYADVYIYKNVIADIDFNTVYSIDEDQVKINLHGGMHGGKKPAEDIDLALTLSDGTQSLVFAYKEQTDNINKTLTNVRSYTIGNGQNDLTLDTRITYDKSTGIINASAALNTPSGGHIDLNGSGTLSKQGGVTKIDAQEIKLDYNGAFTLIMGGTYEIKPLKSKPEQPQGEVVELFKADAAQISEIESTIEQNLKTVTDTVNEALAGITLKTVNETETTETTVEETTETTETQTVDDTGDGAGEIPDKDTDNTEV